MRWWTSGVANAALLGIAVVGVLGTLVSVWFGFLVVLAQIGPIGLSVKGISSPLAWTHRLKRLAVVTGTALVLFLLAGVLTGTPFWVAVALFALPALVDLGLIIMSPIEKAWGTQWVDRAAAKLRAVAPQVVAITGSYGKTSTKNYLAHLLAGSKRTVASPASFNNRMGLAKAINEGLNPGTEVLIAEMGAYGPGEIGELCAWIRPTVSAMVSIGPVHLERFGTEENIVRSKSEILDRTEAGVISVDHPLLARLADERSSDVKIIRVSAANDAIRIDGEFVSDVPGGVFGTNLAVAMGIGSALGLGIEEMKQRLGDLPVTEHRQALSTSELGFTIIDDTFNSNPVGARRGLEVLAEAGANGKTAVVTPGMVEMGSRQYEENFEFARKAADEVDAMVIVGQTNRSSLEKGAAKGSAAVTVVASRAEAIEWVRSSLGPGDAVLYENDLPDHYP